MTKTGCYLPMLRELVRCYQAFERYSSSHIRKLGLTPAQFDIIVTLGNTRGMTFKSLGEETLITKGTLTGVVDRLVEKGLVRRDAFPDDGRCSVVTLTEAGSREFTRIFDPHLDFLGKAFFRLPPGDIDELQRRLGDLRETLETVSSNVEKAAA